MNTLHIFGDSFSEDLDTLAVHAPDTSRMQYSNAYFDSPYPVWSKTLAESLNMVHKNYASTSGKNFEHLGQGNSNHSILYNLNEYVHTFKKDDIVIIGFTSTLRFPWPLDDGDIYASLPNSPNDFSKEESNVLEFITVKRDHDFYKEELLQKMKVFEVLSDVVGFHLYYWSYCPEITNWKREDKLKDKRWIFLQICPEYGEKYHGILDENGGYTINTETNNKFQDAHMGKTGNDVHAKLFSQYLKKELNII